MRQKRLRSRFGRSGFVALVSVGLPLVVACGSDSESRLVDASGPSVVVTHELLGVMVRDLVAESASVTVLMPNGADPHDWEPSAKDIETLNAADLVVANGLDLEAGLVEALNAAEDDGIPVFHATDHVEVVAADDHAHADEGDHVDEVPDVDDDDHGHGHDEGDPHFWTDPLAMADIVEPLATALSEVGIDVSVRAAELVVELRALDDEVATILDEVRDDRRQLVTGHESLGYFASHYGFELVGAVIPSLTTAADVSAADLADLREAIEDTGVEVIFTETGTPSEVVEALADEVGLPVEELATHLLPDDGSYRTFMLDLASGVVEGITA